MRLALLSLLFLPACFGQEDENDSPSSSESPVAVDDSATVDKNSSVVVNLLANDSDADSPLTELAISIFRPPDEGVVVLAGQGSVEYTPTPGWFGADSFFYELRDEDGNVSNRARVHITVNNASDTLEDLGGSWVGVLLESGADPVSSYMSYDNAGLPLQWVGKEDDYDLSRNATGTSILDGSDIFTVDWNIPSLFFRLELVGTLDSPKSTFSGTWKFWDTYADAINPARNGTFSYALSVGSVTRDVADLAGSWAGTWSFPDHGTANVDFVLDSSGALTSGGFDGLRSQGAMAFISGTSLVVDSNTGQFSTTVLDAAQEYGSSEQVQLDGVLPVAGSTWTGVVHHYFWGSGTFQLQRL